MKNRFFSYFVLALLLLSTFAFDETSTREEILESRRRRKVQLEAMLHDAEERLAQHGSGTKILTDDEVKALEKKADIFKRKLETMRDDLDDREIERIMAREKLRNERLAERRKRDEL